MIFSTGSKSEILGSMSLIIAGGFAAITFLTHIAAPLLHMMFGRISGEAKKKFKIKLRQKRYQVKKGRRRYLLTEECLCTKRPGFCGGAYRSKGVFRIYMGIRLFLCVRTDFKITVRLFLYFMLGHIDSLSLCRWERIKYFWGIHISAGICCVFRIQWRKRDSGIFTPYNECSYCPRKDGRF